MDEIAVQLLPINRDRLKELISFAFEGDNDLLDKYHISPGSLEHCVNHTYAFVDKNKDFYCGDMHISSITTAEYGTIGYTVVIINENIPNELYSFGIKKEYRTKGVLAGWLRAVQEELGLPYYIVLWNVNARAIEFFRKNGFIIEERNELMRLTNNAPEMEDKTLIIKSD